jgi:hypothetical protein
MVFINLFFYKYIVRAKSLNAAKVLSLLIFELNCVNKGNVLTFARQKMESDG